MTSNERCAECGVAFDSKNSSWRIPLCHYCVSNRLRDFAEHNVVEIHTSVLTYDRVAGDCVAPAVPLTVQLLSRGAIRIILGDGPEKPDLYIERQHQAWEVAVHPDDSDPIGWLRIGDDGLVVFHPECGGRCVALFHDGARGYPG